MGSTRRTLEGRSAIVTGSTSGIGLGIARALAAESANLLLNGFGDAREIEALRERIASEHRVNVAFDGADIAKPAEARRMVAEATQAFGAVDVLVNNAGIQHTAPTEKSRRALGCDRGDQLIVELPRDRGRSAADEEGN